MIIVADNLQITNQRIADALGEMDASPVREMVAGCVAAGAEAIDINPGPLVRHAEEKMAFLVETVQSATNLPLLLDTTNPVALETGLKVSRNKTIINGFSLEPARLEAILPLAKKFDTDIVGYLLYPDSRVPNDANERITIAIELFNEFQKAGVSAGRLIIDPVIAPVLWENGHRQNIETLGLLGQLPDVLGIPVRTIAGLSNLTTGRGGKEKKLRLERTYLPMLAASGLTMVLMNVFHTETVRVARACNALLSDHVFSWESDF